VAALCALVLAGGCGKKGPPLAPIVRVPVAPDEILLRNQGGRVAFQFRVPSTNSDGSSPADIRRVDVYGYTGSPVDEESIVEDGMLVASIPVREPPREEGEEPSEPAPQRPPGSLEAGFDQGQTLVVFEELGPVQRQPVVPEDDDEEASGSPVLEPARARVYVAVGVSRKGRRGAFSPRSLAPLQPASSAPSRLTLTYDEKQVGATWDPPGDLRRPTLKTPPSEGLLVAKPLGMASSTDAFNVYLRAARDPAATRPAGNLLVTAARLATPLNAEPLPESRFEEPIAAFGVERCYEVTTVSRFGEGVVESEPTPAACIELIDKFAPSAPTGLAAVASTGAVNLIWTANSEPDIGGYIVLRSDGGAAPVALTEEAVKQATFRDDTVKPGVRYSYVVVALDTTGNRSGFSNPVEESAR
jgi:hypothetical protein